jgi:RNA polymerase sigma-70 factor (ECF subfamily)
MRYNLHSREMVDTLSNVCTWSCSVAHIDPTTSDLSLDVVASFETIARTYGNLLLHTARLLVDDEETAEDVVQASLELAWRNLGTLRDRSALRAWLVKIVMNQALSVRRRAARSASYLRATARSFEIAYASAQAAEATAKVETLFDLRAAIRSLPIEQRSVIVLHYYLDMSVAEIAAMMEISPNTIKKRLGAALRRLRMLLGKNPFPDEDLQDGPLDGSA